MYGKVKLGKDVSTGEKRAVKILRKQRLKRMRRIRPGKISDAYQDLLVEIAILKKLRHPNGRVTCEIGLKITQLCYFMTLWMIPRMTNFILCSIMWRKDKC
jgi:serine/threonine protein kinase